MSIVSRIHAITTALALTAGAALACPVESGSVRILANDFPALHAVVDFAEACVGDGASFAKTLTPQHDALQVAALSANPAEYTAKIVANASIVPLLNADLIRPLDDLVAKHGTGLAPHQLIRVDGQIVAIAFMANAQHLVARGDLLQEINLPVPATYEEVLEASAAIRAAGIMDYPFAMLTKAGWNLGEEFVNMYLGHGGEFFALGSANASINNDAGLAAITMLKSLTDYSHPDFLTHDTETVTRMWEAGDLALAVLWGSSVGGLIDQEGASAEIVTATIPANAMRVAGGSIPSATLWWDGFTIARNISDEDAEASFVALMNGISDEMVMANNDKAVWLTEAYVPGRASEGVSMVASGGAAPYPMLPFMGLLHMAAADALPAFLRGEQSAEQTLMDIEAAYTEAARDQGFLP